MLMSVEWLISHECATTLIRMEEFCEEMWRSGFCSLSASFFLLRVSCIYLCIYIYICIHIYICIYLYLHICISISTYVQIYRRKYLYLYLYYMSGAREKESDK